MFLFLICITGFQSLVDGRCGKYEFQCWSGDQCIPNTAVCNGFVDCLKDGSDERINCSTWDTTCPESHWKCPGEWKCIEKEKVCTEGMGYCASGADSNSTFCKTWPCQVGQWKCQDSGYCIPEDQVCDGMADCHSEVRPSGESSDERNCELWNCSSGYWKCLDGSKCIKESSMCRESALCDDRSDTSPLVCSNWTCSEGYSKCSDGKRCIGDRKICNGRRDCPDGTDENVDFCSAYQCPEGMAKCHDGIECFIKKFACSEFPMCTDESDRYMCDLNGCQVGEWQCKITKLCIPQDRVCDGLHDCSDYSFTNDKSDEEGCTNITCRAGHVKCPGDIQCIAAEKVCSEDTRYERVCTGKMFTDGFCKSWKCLPGYMKCADEIHCVKEDIICHGKYTQGQTKCKDDSGQLCDAECAPKDFHGRYVMRRCEEDPSKCIPTFWYCNGVADCPDASDEIHCSCDQRGLDSCKNGTQCIPWGWNIGNHPSCNTSGIKLDDVSGNNHIFEENYWKFSTVNLSSVNKYDNPACANFLQFIVDNMDSQYVRIHINNISCNVSDLSQVVDISTGETSEHKIFSIYGDYTQTFNFFLSLFSSDRFQDNLTVAFENIKFRNSVLSFRNVKVWFSSCIFDDTLISDAVNTEYLRQDSQVHIQVVNCTFSCSSCKVGSGTNTIHVSKSHAVKLVVGKSNLEGISIDIYSTHLWVIVTNSTIEPYATIFKLETPAFNFVETAIQFSNIKAITFQPYFKKTSYFLRVSASYVFLQLINIQLKGVSQAISIENTDQYVKKSNFYILIDGCTFQDNRNAFGSGGAMRINFKALVGAAQSSILIQQSLFKNNHASNEEGSGFILGGGIAINAESSQDVRKPLLVFIESCTFTDNWSEDIGGGLYFSKGNKIFISNTTFLATLEQRQMKDGVFLMSQSQISLQNVTYKVAGLSYPQVSLSIFDLNDINVVEKLDVTMICPAWHRLHKKEHWKPIDEDRLLYINYLHLLCRNCPYGHYAGSSGHNQLIYDKGDEEIGIKTTDLFTRDPEECTICPYGGYCPGDKLSAKSNFWGYVDGETISFQRCPHEYCCSGSNTNSCTNYNSCQGHRTGQLCGACLNGFSLSMLSNECVPDAHCNDQWFWAIPVVIAFGYVFWFTFKDDIVKIFLKFTAFLRLSIRQKSVKQYQKENETVDKGYFGIITYFVQIAAIMTIPVDIIDEKGPGTMQKFKTLAVTILNIDLNTSEMTPSTVCPMKGLTMAGKTLLRILFLVGIRFAWAISEVALYCIIKTIKLKASKYPKIHKLYSEKLVVGFLEICQYTYSGVASVSFMSLTCVPIADKLVWKFDGTVSCLTAWQILVLFSSLFYTLVFPIYLMLAQRKLNLGKISGKQYIIGCLFPFGPIINWSVGSVWNGFIKQRKGVQNSVPSKMAKHKQVDQSNKDKVREVIIEALQGTYRMDDHTASSWEVVIIFRRLILSAKALINNGIICMSLNLTFFMVFSLHHVYVKPFRATPSNHVESLSLVFLCYVAFVNCLKAFYLEMDNNSQGPVLSVLQTFHAIEEMLIFILMGFILAIEVYLKVKAPYVK